MDKRSINIINGKIFISLCDGSNYIYAGNKNTLIACIETRLNRNIRILGNNYDITLKEDNYEYNNKPLTKCNEEATKLFKNSDDFISEDKKIKKSINDLMNKFINCIEKDI